ncbi:MAG TPA: HlyD family efflux transporter periplasmic adaptor subunit [Kofleriaceae bacterium]|nr:HlyD family efflux transporter periplasmic adaptor subunit [Kofleriaceae bacterium]
MSRARCHLGARAALALWLAALACGDGDRADPDRRGAPQPTPVTRRDRPTALLDEVGFVGVLVPRDAHEVVSPLATKIERLLVKLDDPVDKGTPLAILDAREPRERLTLSRSELREGEAAVRQAAIEREAARAKLAREQQALRAGIVSVAEVELATAEADKAVSAVDRTIAEVEKRRETVKQLEQRLADTTLTSPIAGKVALRYVEEGARVREGQAVIRVIRSDELFVKFAIPAAAARTVAADDPIELRLTERGVVAKGVVKRVSPELDPVAQMVLAEAELVTPKGELRAELRAGDTGRVVVVRPPPP